MGVFFDKSEQSSRLQNIKSKIADHDSLDVVSNIEDAELRVYEENGQITIKDRALKTLSFKEVANPAVESLIVNRLAHWGRWYGVLGLENPTPTIDVDVRIHRMGVSGTEPGPQSVTHGTKIGITVTNTSRRDLFVVVLGMSLDGSICVLYPSQRLCEATDQSDVLKPGAKLPIEDIPMFIPDDYPADRSSLTDVVKVFATTQKISGKMFELGPVPRGAPLETRANESPLSNYIRRIVVGRSRNFGGGGPIDADGWVTKERSIRVVRPVATQPSFAIHVSEADAARGPTTLPGARSLCSQPSETNCYAVQAFSGDNTIVEIQTPTSRGAQELISVGQAFDEAYRLREETGALRAEPLFDIAVTGIAEGTKAASRSARGGSGPKHDSRANNDALWSLKHVRAMDAWQVVQSKRNKPAGFIECLPHGYHFPGCPGTDIRGAGIR